MTQLSDAGTLGADLRRLRLKLHLNQGALARRARVSQMTVSRVERGCDHITQKIIDRVTNALLVAHARRRGPQQ